jgi:hypothetical protein
MQFPPLRKPWGQKNQPEPFCKSICGVVSPERLDFPPIKMCLYYIMLSEVFWTIFLTTVSGFLLKLASMAYKSKCKSCKVCCIEVIRDTEAEIELDEFKIEHTPPPKSPTAESGLLEESKV